MAKISTRTRWKSCRVSHMCGKRQHKTTSVFSRYNWLSNIRTNWNFYWATVR